MSRPIGSPQDVSPPDVNDVVDRTNILRNTYPVPMDGEPRVADIGAAAADRAVYTPVSVHIICILRFGAAASG